MANFVLNAPRPFPNGTEVKAYPVTNWPGSLVRRDAAPVGAAASTQTMTSGTLTFTGLTQDAHYVAHAQVGGQHRYVDFIAGADVSATGIVTHAALDAEIAALTPEAWHEIGAGGEPAFQGGWTNLAAFNTAAFRKDAHGLVHLKGVCIAAGTGFTLFTLPVGYRPPVQNIQLVNGGSGVTTAARLTIEADGDVVSSTQTAGQSTVLDRVAFWTG